MAYRSSDESGIVVAIPARNEAERIGPCLMALNNQQRLPDSVMLVLDDCSDGTETIVRAMMPSLRFHLEVILKDANLVQSGAGYARRFAMAVAAARAGPGGVLLTTDADSVVPSDWVVHNLGALEQGAEAVCGRAVICPTEATRIPAHLHADDALECRFVALLDDLAWLLDPEPHDPPPRHTEASGASLAVSVAAFQRVGGIPAIASGEDREFVRGLWMMDARIRHEPAIEVTVSGRMEGRAIGGMADTIRRRMIKQDEYADELAEPAGAAFRRYQLRRRVRRAWSGLGDTTLADDLDLPRRMLTDTLMEPHFGRAWAKLEDASHILQRKRVRFTDLPAEIEIASALRRRLVVPEALAAD